MYSSSAHQQAEASAQPRAYDFARREGRAAYVKAYGRIPPQFLPEREARALGFQGQGRTERSTPWLAEPIIFPMIERLSRGKLGYCNATEYTLRLWAWEHTGHPFGQRTISRRLRQEAARGRLERKLVPPGGRFKTGQITRNGTTSNRFPTEKERRERLWRERNEKRKQRREARDRKRARERAERLVRPSAEPAQFKPQAGPRTALAAVTGDERPVCELPFPAFLRDDVRPAEIDEAARRAHAAEVSRQLAAALAHPELWDQPPD